MSKWKKAVLFAVVLLAFLLIYPGLSKESGAKTDISMEEYEEIIGTYNIDDSILSYKDYLKEHANAAYPKEAVIIGADNCVRYEEDGVAVSPKVYKDYEGRSGNSILTSETGLIEYEFEIKETGFYNLSFLYYPEAGKNSEIERSIFIDGKLPFKELSMVTFQRVWASFVENTRVNEHGVTEKLWEKDNQGNDVKPSSMEVPEWQTRYVYDSDGYIPPQSL